MRSTPPHIIFYRLAVFAPYFCVWRIFHPRPNTFTSAPTKVALRLKFAANTKHYHATLFRFSRSVAFRVVLCYGRGGGSAYGSFRLFIIFLISKYPGSGGLFRCQRSCPARCRCPVSGVAFALLVIMLTWPVSLLLSLLCRCRCCCRCCCCCCCFDPVRRCAVAFYINTRFSAMLLTCYYFRACSVFSFVLLLF